MSLPQRGYCSAQREDSLLEASLLRLDLLVLDEVGFVSFSKVGAELLFGVLVDASVARCSSPPTWTSPWTDVFGDARLTGALLDRLTPPLPHHRVPERLLPLQREPTPQGKDPEPEPAKAIV